MTAETFGAKAGGEEKEVEHQVSTTAEPKRLRLEFGSIVRIVSIQQKGRRCW